MKRYLLPFVLILLLMAAGCSQASDQYKITVASGGRWPPKGSGESDKEITGKGGLRKDSPKSDNKTEDATEATTAKKKKSTSATTAVDPFDHDIEAYYEDNKDIYDSFDDAWDGFEDDQDAWDDY